MQKFTFLLFFAFSLVNGFAQVVISSGDMPVPGLLPRYSIDSAQSVNPSAITGPNQIWDYSTLVPSFQRVDTFVTPPSTYAANFPGATVAIVRNGNGASAGGFTFNKGYNFYKTSTAGFDNLGTGGNVSGFDLSLYNNPADHVYKFPLNYDDRDTSYSEATLQIPFFLYVHQEQTRIYHVDSWGDLTTPFGTFSTIRVRNELTGYDTISVPSQSINFGNPRPLSIEYKWLTKGEKVPVLSVTGAFFNGVEQMGNAVYRDSLRPNVPMLGIAQNLQPVKGKMYPNPASERVELELQAQLGGKATMNIYDMAGKLMLSETFDGLAPISASVNTLAEGTYLVRVVSEKKVYEGKLTIKH